jgi:hypothetical protein
VERHAEPIFRDDSDDAVMARVRFGTRRRKRRLRTGDRRRLATRAERDQGCGDDERRTGRREWSHEEHWIDDFAAGKR